VGRALPGLDAGCRDAFVGAGCVAGFMVDCLEGGSEEPNAECCLLGRVDVAERMRSFLSARGICAVRFPSVVCLLMPDGSNDLGACDGWMDGSELRIRKMRFEDKAVDFLGKKWRAGCAVLDIGTDRGSSHLRCGAPRGSRGGRSLAARWIGAGHSPHIVEREPELSLMYLRFVVTSRARSIVAPARPAYASVRPKARGGVPARRRERARPGLGAGGPRGPRGASIPPAVRHALSPSTTRHLLHDNSQKADYRLANRPRAGRRRGRRGVSRVGRGAIAVHQV
jgi:hypothetical protein